MADYTEKPMDIEKADLEIVEPTTPVDLEVTSATTTLNDEPATPHTITYPDGGYGWVNVLSSFLVHFFIWGIAFSYGVYLQNYAAEVFPTTPTATLSFIGTSSSGIMGVFGLVSGRMADRFGYKSMMFIGGTIAGSGLILASFATEIWHLYLTQSFLFGLGGSLTFTAAISIPSQWFEKHRALATGIAVSGSGIGGLAIAPLIRLIMANLGWHWALRIMGIASLVFLNLAAFIAKTRLPPPKRGPLFDFAVFKDARFLALFITGFFTYCGFLVPFFLMSNYTVFVGGSVTQGALLVGLISGAGAVGRIAMGLLADRFGRINMLIMANFVSGVAVLAIWGNASSFGILLLFALVFGLFSGGFISLAPVVTAQIFGMQRLATIVSLILFSSAAPGTVGTPIASWIVQAQGGYMGAIMYTGFALIIASLCTLYLKYLTSGGLKGLITRQ